MKKIIFIALLLMLITYIAKQISFADTSHFDEDVQAFTQEYGVEEIK